MKKFLISLDKDHIRRELFFAQPNTIDFQVFSAINTMETDEIELKKHFNFKQFQTHYGRKVTKGEIGCTLSHLSVYQIITEDLTIPDQDYVLICEDDALFNQHFQKHLDNLLNQPQNADIILVGQSKIATFDDIELEINYPTTFRFLQKKPQNYNFKLVYPYKNYFAGTVAYLIKKSTAYKFLEKVRQEKIPYWLADDFILFSQQFHLDIHYVRPLLAIENPRLNSNLNDARGPLSNNLGKKLIKYPLKKLMAIKRNLGK